MATQFIEFDKANGAQRPPRPPFGNKTLFIDESGEFKVLDGDTGIEEGFGGGGGEEDGGGTVSSPTQTSAVFVSKAGSDSNNGLRPETPKLTIGSAITAAAALKTAGAPGVRVEVMDGGTYVENISVPANVQINALAAQLQGTVSLTAEAEIMLDRHLATANNQNMVTMDDASSGPAIYHANVTDGRGTTGTLTGVQCVRNIGGGGKNLFIRCGIMYVGIGGVGLGDTTSGFGHIHIQIEDLYLGGDNAIGIQAGASGGPNVANMVGMIHHILEIASPVANTVGISVTNASAVVKLVAAEIVADTAFNVSAGDLWLTCPKITGGQVGQLANRSNYTFATVPTAATNAGRVIYVSDGSAGSPCAAISNGTNWLVISLGSAISGS